MTTTISLPDEVRDMIAAVRLGFFATVSRDGVPNVSPKGSIRAVDEQTLAFVELMSPHTRANLEQNPIVAVLVFDPSTRKGYQIKGKAELISSGPLWEKLALPLVERGYKPNYVVKIAPEEIFPISG